MSLLSRSQLQQVRREGDSSTYVRVESVGAGSPADRECVAGGDEIKAVNGVDIEGQLDDAVEAIRALKVGKPLVLDVKRGSARDEDGVEDEGATACPYYLAQEVRASEEPTTSSRVTRTDSSIVSCSSLSASPSSSLSYRHRHYSSPSMPT